MFPEEFPAFKIITTINLCIFILATSNEVTYTWSGQLPPRHYKNPTYSTKVFLGGVPWDITESKYNYYYLIFIPVVVYDKLFSH